MARIPRTTAEATLKHQEARDKLDVMHRDVSLIANPENNAVTPVDVIEELPWLQSQIVLCALVRL